MFCLAKPAFSASYAIAPMLVISPLNSIVPEQLSEYEFTELVLLAFLSSIRKIKPDFAIGLRPGIRLRLSAATDKHSTVVGWLP